MEKISSNNINPKIIKENDINYFWVNIGKSKKEVKEKKFLWAPAYTYLKDGKTKTINAGWKHVPDVKKGDVLFCQFDKKIHFIAIATTDAYKNEKPQEQTYENWKKEGYKIEIDLIVLDNPINRDIFKEEIKLFYNDKCSPKLFTKNESITQQYLISLPKGAGALLLDCIGDKSIEIYDKVNEKKLRKKPDIRQREAIIKARVGQGMFREEVLNLWNNTCPITKVKNKELLIASHIVSWQLSNDEEKLDKYNGLPLTPNVDKLFDKGFISFSDEGNLLIHKSFDKNIIKQLGIAINTRIEGLKPKHKYYLQRHREQYNF